MGEIYYIGDENCNGCKRNNIIYLHNFPDDYPRDKMLCCACTSSYYHHLEIPKPSNMINYSENFYIVWWHCNGERIEKAMRIQ